MVAVHSSSSSSRQQQQNALSQSTLETVVVVVERCHNYDCCRRRSRHHDRRRRRRRHNGLHNVDTVTAFVLLTLKLYCCCGILLFNLQSTRILKASALQQPLLTTASCSQSRLTTTTTTTTSETKKLSCCSPLVPSRSCSSVSSSSSSAPAPSSLQPQSSASATATVLPVADTTLLIDNNSEVGVDVDSTVDTTNTEISAATTSTTSTTTISGSSSHSTKLAIWKLAIAGAIATLIGDASMHPLDTIKTLQQSEEGIGLSFVSSAYVILTSSATATATTTASIGGSLSGFYRGFMACIYNAIGGAAIKFATYEGLKRYWEENHHHHHPATTASSSSSCNHNNSNDNNCDQERLSFLLQSMVFIFAGISFVTSSIVAVPGELIKQHLQMGHYDTVWDAITSIGPDGLYRGYDGVLLRDVPHTAMELGLYDVFKRLYLNKRSTMMMVMNNPNQTSQQNGQSQQGQGHLIASYSSSSPSQTITPIPRLFVEEEQAHDETPIYSLDASNQGETLPLTISTAEQLLLAGITGGVAGFLTTPFDTIKTKLMVDAQFIDLSFWDATVLTIHDHGIATLFCGAFARVAWLVPNTAIYLTAYEFLQSKLLQQHKEEEEGEEARDCC